MNIRPVTKEEYLQVVLSQIPEEEAYTRKRIEYLAKRNQHLFLRSFKKLLFTELVSYQFSKATYDSF